MTTKSDNIPHIKPLKTAEYTCTQSKYKHVGKLPTRSLILAPSGGGKTVLISNLILDVYRNCFKRIYIFSPSIHIDAAWRPVISYCTKELEQIEDKNERLYFDSYNQSDLQHIVNTQYKVVDWMKKNKYTDIYQILIVIDDFADDKSFCRNSTLLHSLYIRGRHLFISTITATQVYKAITPIIRKNLTNIYVFRLRNKLELDALLEEYSALYDKNTLLELYNEATFEPHGFLYIDLMQSDKRKMFFKNLDQILTVDYE